MSHPSENAMTADAGAVGHDSDLEQLAQAIASARIPVETAEASLYADEAGTLPFGEPDDGEVLAIARAVLSSTWLAERDQESRRLLELVHHLRQYGECAPGGHETWAQLDVELEHHLRGLRRPDPLEHLCRRGEGEDPWPSEFPTLWMHCSPALLGAGLSCGLTPRRTCQCDHGGSHDHLVDAHAKRVLA
jgi:hypothetical protein